MNFSFPSGELISVIPPFILIPPPYSGEIWNKGGLILNHQGLHGAAGENFDVFALIFNGECGFAVQNIKIFACGALECGREL